MRGSESPELIVVNARIWTGDVHLPEAQALAVSDGRFVAVGTNDDIRRLANTRTEVIDAGGRRLIPGLTDSHVHFVAGGMSLSEIDLRDVKSKAEFVDALAARVAQAQPGEWIIGGRWTTDSWADPSPPSAAWIDRATPDNPVFLPRMDGHQVLVNSAALRIAGITAAGPDDPVGGQIDRDPATREPTGILRDEAIGLVRKHIPATGSEERYRAAMTAMRYANSLGVTMVHDMSEWPDLQVYRKLHDDGKLTVRIRCYASVDDWNDYLEPVKSFPVRDDWLTVAGFKAYMDGSLGSRTAYMREPYSDNPAGKRDARGLLMPIAASGEPFVAMLAAADRAGFQAAVHAIGDEANHRLLEAHRRVTAKNGKRDRRPRVEHVQHLLPEDVARFAAEGVVASMQPYHKADDARYAEKAIGPDRCRTSYAFRDLVESGAVVAFGSDWPVVSLNPFVGIETAVTGKTVEGRIWEPQQNISMEQALRCYTTGPAKAAFMEDRLGVIAPGKLADFVLIDRDILDPDAAGEVAQTKVRLTVAGGKVVYRDLE